MPKVLILDIETAPMKGVFWGVWKQNIGMNQVEQDWYILTYAAKWLGSDEVLFDGLIEYQDLYKKEPENDIRVMESLHALLDEADLVVAHNGKRFDIPKINARFLGHGMMPPSPYKQVDTLQVVKKKFALQRNTLEFVATFLGLGGKMQHAGMDMWLGCMAGDLHAWRDMIKYNIQDVELLEDVYLKLLPWIDQHPNMALYHDDNDPRCPKCGGTHINWRGYAYTPLGKFHRFQCKSCGGWGRSRITAMGKEKRKGVMANAQF